MTIPVRMGSMSYRVFPQSLLEKHKNRLSLDCETVIIGQLNQIINKSDL